MELFGGVNSGVAYSSITKDCMDSSNPISPWSNGMQPSMQPMGELPRLLYRAMLISKQERDRLFKYSDPGTLEIFARYVQNKELKKEIYQSIREQIFRNSHSKSIIVNEVMGAVDMAKRVVLYGIATVKIYF